MENINETYMAESYIKTLGLGSKSFVMAATRLGIPIKIIEGDEGRRYIEKVGNKYKNMRYLYHPMIDVEVEFKTTNPAAEERRMGDKLPAEPAYFIFSEESKDLDRRRVAIVDDGRRIVDILKKSEFELEYFISDFDVTYIISRSWYSLAASGWIADKFRKQIF